MQWWQRMHSPHGSVTPTPAETFAWESSADTVRGSLPTRWRDEECRIAFNNSSYPAAGVALVVGYRYRLFSQLNVCGNNAYLNSAWSSSEV